MEHGNDHFTLFVLKDLEKLTELERATILSVTQRNEQLEKAHSEQFEVLKTEIETLQRVRDAEVDFALCKDACALCMLVLGKLFNAGRTCPSCSRTVCRSCQTPFYALRKRWMCILCAKEWQLRIAAGSWMDKKEFAPRRSIPDFVLRTLLSFRDNLRGYGTMKLHAEKLAIEAKAKKDNPRTATFLLESGSSEGTKKRNKKNLKHATDIDCSPKFPRRSLHGPVRPLPLPVPEPIGLVQRTPTPPRTPTFGEKLDHVFHEAAHILHIRSDNVLHTGLKFQPTPRGGSNLRRRASSESDLTKTNTSPPLKVVTVVKKPEENNALSIAPFEFSSSTLLPSEDVGLKTSTPNDEIEGSITMGNPKRALKMDELSISTVGSAMEDHHAHFAEQTLGDVLIRVGYGPEKDMLMVGINRCRNLPLFDTKKTVFPSPYVKVYLYAAKGGMVKKKTGIQKKTCNPHFMEVLMFPLPEKEAVHSYLHVSVTAKRGLLRKSVILGETTIMISDHWLKRAHPIWTPLHKV